MVLLLEEEDFVDVKEKSDLHFERVQFQELTVIKGKGRNLLIEIKFQNLLE